MKHQQSKKRFLYAFHSIQYSNRCVQLEFAAMVSIMDIIMIAIEITTAIIGAVF